MTQRKRIFTLFLLGALPLAGAQASPKGDPTAYVEAIQATTEIPEDLLLDVGIHFFDPGLPEGDPTASEDKGVYDDIRGSEARYIPIHLARTLQSTGQWGAVRVVPASAQFIDVIVDGEILASTGRDLALRVSVRDAGGKTWLQRKYRSIADPSAYGEKEVDRRDPYQSLYNQVANDLLAQRQRFQDDELRTLRQVARMRFAADLVPVAYGDYLRVNKKGRYRIARLPAADDPMMERISAIRERDQLFVDTLNEHYSTFYARMNEPYDDWRSFSYEEQEALRKLRKQARMEKIFGALAIIGAAAVGGNSSVARATRTAATLGGAMALQDGMEKSKEAKMNVEALKELAQSFDADVAPLLVELEGRTMRLTGSLDEQYTSWRQLLHDLFLTETGFPLDPNDRGVVAGGAEPQ